jgi:hypothetical protein
MCNGVELEVVTAITDNSNIFWDSVRSGIGPLKLLEISTVVIFKSET